jgi:hypothetical protein
MALSRWGRFGVAAGNWAQLADPVDRVAGGGTRWFGVDRQRN